MEFRKRSNDWYVHMSNESRAEKIRRTEKCPQASRNRALKHRLSSGSEWEMKIKCVHDGCCEHCEWMCESLLVFLKWPYSIKCSISLYDTMLSWRMPRTLNETYCDRKQINWHTDLLSLQRERARARGREKETMQNSCGGCERTTYNKNLKMSGIHAKWQRTIDWLAVVNEPRWTSDCLYAWLGVSECECVRVRVSENDEKHRRLCAFRTKFPAV